jgi:hypothetical protein
VTESYPSTPHTLFLLVAYIVLLALVLVNLFLSVFSVNKMYPANEVQYYMNIS